MISLPDSETQAQEDASHCTCVSQQIMSGHQAGGYHMSHAAHYESVWLLG